MRIESAIKKTSGYWAAVRESLTFTDEFCDEHTGLGLVGPQFTVTVRVLVDARTRRNLIRHGRTRLQARCVAAGDGKEGVLVRILPAQP